MSDVPYTAPPPNRADVRFDDVEFNPAIEPKESKAWLNLLKESEDAFEKWNDHCDKIEKQYANLERLANGARDKQFQMFWANIEVEKPAIYSNPPEPVVVTKFKDRRPVYQAAAEMAERCATVAFDLAHINELMLMIRDDVVLIGRGVPWCRYESGKERGSYYDGERVCIDFKSRKDFLHSISRNWSEVTWVAAASYLTRPEARDRFRKYSGDAYQDADYKVDRDTREVGGADNRERAKFWEIWHKGERRVVWVSEGCEDILDEDDPHLDLSDFFPCPKPAYGTVQRNSLVPVPDVLQYKDQLDELNLLTAKIHALSEALEAKGFYPAGGAEIAEAVQAAIANNTPGRLLVPISNWSAFGGTNEVIIWLPIDQIASTITQLVTLRQQIINDIYQIMGLSDIMRGATDPRETLGAQDLKAQYGSTRVRDKQAELVRCARDLVQIVSEIIFDKFDDTTIIDMSQTQLPTKAMQDKQLRDLHKQLENQTQGLQKLQQLAQTNPQLQQMNQQNPQQLQQVQQQGQQLIASGQEAITKITAQPNLDQVLELLRDERMKNFVLDIETDSTIQIDEDGEKERRNEFVGMLAQLLPQLAQMMAAQPKTASFCGEILKFATAPYRAGRSLDGAIDDLVSDMMEQANQPQNPDPATLQAQTAVQIEQIKDQRERARDQQDGQLKAQELQMKDAHAKMKIQSDQAIEMAKLQRGEQADQAKAQQTNLQAMHDREEHQSNMLQSVAKLRETQMKGQAAQQMEQLKAADFQRKSDERRAMQQFKMSQPQPPRGAPGL